MTIQQIDTRKEELLKKARKLADLKKVKYSNMPIDSPMSHEEKELNKEVTNLYSQVNRLIKERRRLN